MWSAGEARGPVNQVEKAGNLLGSGQLWKGLEGKIKDLKSHPPGNRT